MGKGNVKKQRKNHKANKHTVRQIKPYEMIDGNLTYQPYAYCTYYNGWLTKAMANRHRCEKRHCERFELLDPQSGEVYKITKVRELT